MKRTFRYHLSRLWFPIFALFLLVYFTYHLIQGDHGFLSWQHLDQELEGAEQKLAQLQTTQNALEKKVNALKADQLDPDLLDERVRQMLNHADKGEVIVFYED